MYHFQFYCLLTVHFKTTLINLFYSISIEISSHEQFERRVHPPQARVRRLLQFLVQGKLPERGDERRVRGGVQKVPGVREEGHPEGGNRFVGSGAVRPGHPQRAPAPFIMNIF